MKSYHPEFPHEEDEEASLIKPKIVLMILDIDNEFLVEVASEELSLQVTVCCSFVCPLSCRRGMLARTNTPSPLLVQSRNHHERNFFEAFLIISMKLLCIK